MDVLDRKVCAQMWDTDDFRWVTKPSIGSAGGFLIILNSSSFELVDTFESVHFLA